MWCLLSTCWLIMSYCHYRHTADYWMVTVKQQHQLVLTCWDKVISYKSMSSHQQQIFMQVDFKVKYNTLPVFTNIPETFWDVGDWNGVGGHVLSHKAYWWYFGSNVTCRTLPLLSLSSNCRCRYFLYTNYKLWHDSIFFSCYREEVKAYSCFMTALYGMFEDNPPPPVQTMNDDQAGSTISSQQLQFCFKVIHYSVQWFLV